MGVPAEIRAMKPGTGYEVKGYKSEPYEKKGKLFGLL